MGGWGFDLQLDVTENGCVLRDFGLEVYLEGERKAASGQKDETACAIFQPREASGVADGRWRKLEAIDMSRRVALPQDGVMRHCSVSLRLFSAKARFVDGKPRLAKAHLRGDAVIAH